MQRLRSIYTNLLLTGPMREYIIEKVKKPLERALLGVAGLVPRRIRYCKFLAKVYLFWDVWNIVMTINRYPEPTRENCTQPNIHVLFDIWDWFLEHQDPRCKYELFKAARRLHLATYGHDPSYEERFDVWVEKLVIAYLDGSWQPRTIGRPAAFWNEPIAEQEAKQEKIKQFLRRE